MKKLLTGSIQSDIVNKLSQRAADNKKNFKKFKKVVDKEKRL